MNVKPLTPKQISNAYDRAAKIAHALVSADQQVNFAATTEQLRSERGAAQCAAGFAAQALANLQAGNYQQFLTDIKLAGDFAKQADDARYKRQPDSRPMWQPRDLHAVNAPLGPRTGF
jgi:hypothetical protein